MIYCLNPKCYSPDTKQVGAKYVCNKCGLTFIILHEYQVKALASDKRFILILSGVQGGKSEVGAKWIRDQIVSNWNEDGDYLVAAPTFKILAQSTLSKFLDEVNLFKLGKFNKQDMVYTLKNKRKVFLRSTEDPNSLEAMTLKACWLDEVGQMKKAVWTNIRHGRVTVLRGRIFMTTTPYANYWWPVSEVINLWKKGDEDIQVIQFPTIANPSINQDDIKNARKTMDPRVYSMRYEGLYVKMSGLIYPDFGVNNIEECPDQSKIITWIGGMDFGHNFSFLLIGRDKDGNYWCVNEVYEQGGLLKEHTAKIKELIKGKDIFSIYYDPSEPGLANELRALGLPNLVPGNNDVENGINRVGQLIKSQRLKISKSCKNLIDELETYHRKTVDDMEGEAKVVKTRDHASDSLRYACLTYPDEDIVVPPEPKKEWEYESQLDYRRSEVEKQIKEKVALRERNMTRDDVLGSDW